MLQVVCRKTALRMIEDYTAKKQSSTYTAQCYTTNCMSRISKTFLILTIIALSIFLLITLSDFGNLQVVHAQHNNTGSNAVVIQATATPEPITVEDRSEIGKTDWITLMSITIVIIIVVPIFLKRKSWSQE